MKFYYFHYNNPVIYFYDFSKISERNHELQKCEIFVTICCDIFLGNMQTEFLEADDVVTTAIQKQNCNTMKTITAIATMRIKTKTMLHLFQ